jgi:hypothetical protein
MEEADAGGAGGHLPHIGGGGESMAFSCHTLHVTRHTSHVTRHMSHVTRLMLNARSILLPRRRARWRRWWLSSRGGQEGGRRFGGGRLLLAAAEEQCGHAELWVIRLQEQARQRPVSMTHFISSLIIAACSTLPLPSHVYTRTVCAPYR